jgi:NAD(P)-dependent dehydrogenase (short-subunit alcohol dehydrogenase family)
VNSNILGLDGKSSLVVGGGSGIGRASALLMAQAGAQVTIADIDAQRAATVSDEAKALGASTSTAIGDVTDPAAAEAAVAAAVEFAGGIDVLINIVGMAAWTQIFDLDEATWDLEMARNLRHHLYVARAAAKRMVEQGHGGSIAVVASVSGIYGAPNHAAYGAAKAALMALSRSMANEWGQFGIRVNAIAPDGINTPRVLAMRESRGTNTPAHAVIERHLLGRFGTPEEIAGPLVFMVSDLASFVTGQTLIVDGGRRSAFPLAAPSM